MIHDPRSRWAHYQCPSLAGRISYKGIVGVVVVAAAAAAAECAEATRWSDDAAAAAAAADYRLEMYYCL